MDTPGPLEVDTFDAAAFDLLAALESMLAWEPHVTLRDGIGREGRTLARADAVEAARAAIAKAKGEA